jgi:UDP-glucose 4,6-dehydratase
MNNILVTGGLGFIGSNFVNYVSKAMSHIKIVILDKFTYCSSKENVIKSDNVEIVIGDIQNIELILFLCQKYKFDHIVHFAAESHVDNSFCNPLSFTLNNVYGTHCLLEACKKYHDETREIKKFLHISTDEVYGDTNDNIKRDENGIPNATNPYAASKVAAEAVVKSYYISYKFPIIITRSNNIYGINQYPDKVIPTFIYKLMKGEKLQIQGSGLQKRCFLHVDDLIQAFLLILDKGVIDNVYNISSNLEFTIIDLAKTMVEIYSETSDKKEEDIIEYIQDRNFNDSRYLIDDTKIRNLGWNPVERDFKEEIKKMIVWYKNNITNFRI